MKYWINYLGIAILGGIMGGLLVFNYSVKEISKEKTRSEDQMIKDFYDTENAVHVSPHGLRKSLGKGDQQSFILVDLRSQEEYEQEHIIGAINIPAYKDPDTSAYGDSERIVDSFSKLPKDKAIIVYCYSIPCMTGRKIGKMLAKKGIYVKHLGVGWNEWRYFWKLWNHAHEWDKVKVEDYVVSGLEPGKIKNNSDEIDGCKINNEFGC